jgi:hypothetical protein
LTRIDPICIWLKSDNVKRAIDRTVDRQRDDAANSGNQAQDANWGAWNEGVTMTRDQAAGRFVQIQDTVQILRNIAGLMAVNFGNYQNAANDVISVDNIKLGSKPYERLVTKICAYLDGTRTANPRQPTPATMYEINREGRLVPRAE